MRQVTMREQAKEMAKKLKVANQFEENHAIVDAVLDQNFDELRSIIDKEEDLAQWLCPEAPSVSPLHMACVVGSTDIVQQLLDAASSLPYDVRKAFNAAVKFGYVSIVRKLASFGVDPPRNTLLAAVNAKQVSLARALCKPPYDEEIMARAVTLGHIALVEALLDGYDVAFVSPELLYLAASKSDKKMAEYLIGQCFESHSALDLALASGSEPAVNMLMELQEGGFSPGDHDTGSWKQQFGRTFNTWINNVRNQFPADFLTLSRLGKTMPEVVHKLADHIPALGLEMIQTVYLIRLIGQLLLEKKPWVLGDGEVLGAHARGILCMMSGVERSDVLLQLEDKYFLAVMWRPFDAHVVAGVHYDFAGELDKFLQHQGLWTDSRANVNDMQSQIQRNYEEMAKEKLAKRGTLV